jgi:hypothetical protein
MSRRIPLKAMTDAQLTHKLHVETTALVGLCQSCLVLLHEAEAPAAPLQALARLEGAD